MQYDLEHYQLGQQIHQVILTSTDPQTTLLRLSRTLGTVFRVDLCLVVALDHFATPVQFGWWSTDDRLTLPGETQARLLSHPLLTEVKADSEPWATSDVHASKMGWFEEVLPARAILRISTNFQGSANGTIALGCCQPHEWMPSEKELLKQSADPVAIALAQVQLQQQLSTHARHKNLQKRLTQAIHHHSELEPILNLALAETAQALQVDQGFVLMLKYADPLFQNRLLKGTPKAKATVAYQWSAQTEEAPSKEWSDSSFQLEESPLCLQAWKNSPQPLAVANQADFPDIFAGNQPELFPSTMPAMLVVPLTGKMSSDSAQAMVLGFFVFQHHHIRPWQSDELELVNWVSTQLSTAMLHHQTVRQVQSLVDERTAQLQRSLDVQAKLHEKTRQQVEQLQQLNQLKDEFLSTMSHELNTPLTNMKMAIQMLRQSQLPSDRQVKYLDILDQELTREHSLIRDLLTLQQLDTEQPSIQPQKLDLKSLLSELAQSFEQKWVNCGLTLVLDDHTGVESEAPLTIYTDPDSLKRILLELLTNAGKYSDPDSTVRLEVTLQEHSQANQVVVTLSNLGAGISPKEQAYIFEPFRRGQGITQKAIPGTGLGLALVKSLVQHINGKIEVASSPTPDTSTETCFTLTLPQFLENTPPINNLE